MSDGFYLDNDVVIKTSSYNAEQQLLLVTSTDKLPPAILALARFTCRTRIERSEKLVNKVSAIASLDAILANVRSLEPTDAEVQIAAEFEELAAEANLSFDTGESQIVAMLLQRDGVAFITGDKRAINALAYVSPGLEQKVASLEQLISSMLINSGLEPLRTAVCREKVTDIAIHNCFQCSAEEINISQVLMALKSYTDSIRPSAVQLLLPTDDLSGAVVS